MRKCRIGPLLRLELELDGEEWCILDKDPAFFHRGDEIILVPFPLEDRGEQFHQRQPADRRFQVIPGAVGGDAHVEVAAERRIPKLDRRRALAGSRHRARDGIEAARFAAPFVSHWFPANLHSPGRDARAIVIARRTSAISGASRICCRDGRGRTEGIASLPPSQGNRPNGGFGRVISWA